MPYPQPCKYQAEHPPTDLVLNTFLFSQGHSVITTLKDQKPLHVRSLFCFLVCNVISIKVCKELGRGSSPFAAQHFVVCGLRKAFIRKNVTKNFLLSPIKSCASPWIRFWNAECSPCTALTGWSLWQLWWSLSSTLHLMPRFPLPVLSWYPHSQGPCALNCSAELRAAARGSLSLLGLCCALHGRDRLSLQTPLVTTSQPDWQADTTANTAAVIGLCRKYLSFKSSLFWFDSETDTRPCAPEFIGWRTSRQWKAKLKKIKIRT